MVVFSARGSTSLKGTWKREEVFGCHSDLGATGILCPTGKDAKYHAIFRTQMIHITELPHSKNVSSTPIKKF